MRVLLLILAVAACASHPPPPAAAPPPPPPPPATDTTPAMQPEPVEKPTGESGEGGVTGGDPANAPIEQTKTPEPAKKSGSSPKKPAPGRTNDDPLKEDPCGGGQ